MGVEGQALDSLVAAGFSEEIEELTGSLLARVMWRYVIADPSFLPEDRSILVRTVSEDSPGEEKLEDRQSVWTVPRTKRSIRNLGLAMQTENMGLQREIDLAVAIAVASVGPIFSKDQAASARLREEALSAIPEVERRLPKAASLFVQGNK